MELTGQVAAFGAISGSPDSRLDLLGDFGFKAMGRDLQDSLRQREDWDATVEVREQTTGHSLLASLAFRSLVLGQVIAVMNTLTGIFSSTLTEDGVNIPTIQSSLNYLMLAPLLVLAYPQIRSEGLKLPWWRYALWALADVEGNYLVVLAYRYTSVASAMLLDGFTGPAAMLLSRFLLGTSYTKYHVGACVVCLFGLSLTIFSDSLSSKTESSTPHAWFGDLLVLLGSLCYATSNVQEEHLLKHQCSRYEALGMLGIFGSIICCIQAVALEGKVFLAISWTWKDVACILGFQLCLFGIYMLVSIFLRMADAAVFNMSLLTCDVYSIIFSWQVQHKQISWTYGVAFLLTISGLIWYHRQPPPTQSGEPLI
mmetsp:Transcript_56001/g.124919  ORF Transcript_56001/g.124919 Transcript_56001/m.124919 type:complete len:369 (+) Transcript_56001:52-1158(+)